MELYNIANTVWGVFDNRVFWLDHPYISSDDHSNIIGQEYMLLRKSLPVEKVVIKL